MTQDEKWLCGALVATTGAPPTSPVDRTAARELAGHDALYNSTKRSDASNNKVKRAFNFERRRLEWLAQ